MTTLFPPGSPQEYANEQAKSLSEALLAYEQSIMAYYGSDWEIDAGNIREGECAHLRKDLTDKIKAVLLLASTTKLPIATKP